MFEDSFEKVENPTRMQKSDRRKSNGGWMGFDESGSNQLQKPSHKYTEYDDYEDADDYKLYSRRDPKREARKNTRRKDKWAETWDF